MMKKYICTIVLLAFLSACTMPKGVGYGYKDAESGLDVWCEDNICTYKDNHGKEIVVPVPKEKEDNDEQSK